MPWELRDGEPVITTGLVRALLTEQHPDLAGLPIGDGIRGWDNTMVRLGEHLALRLPRHAAAARLLDREVTWLPRLAAQLDVGHGSAGTTAAGTSATDPPPFIPTPARTGVPAAGFPFGWAVVPWVDGTPAIHASVDVRDTYATELAATLRAIHQPAPAGVPVSAFRGIGVADLANRYAERRDDLAAELSPSQRDTIDAVWAEALAAPGHVGARSWLHGDPHPNNTVLVRPGTGSIRPVLVDFGDLCAGDPASDLGSALLHFSPDGREAFRTSYDTIHAAGMDHTAGPHAEALWARAHGWAVYFTLVFAAQPPGEPLRPLGRDLLLG